MVAVMGLFAAPGAVTVTFAIWLPLGRFPVDGVSVRVPAPLELAGEGVSQTRLLEAVQGMLPVPVLATVSVTGGGDEPTALKISSVVGVTASVADDVAVRVSVTGTWTGEPADGVKVSMPL